MKKIFPKLGRKRRHQLKVGIMVSSFLLVVALLAKPSYRAFRDWRIEGNAADASEALAAGHYTEARRLAMSVLKLESNRHDMLLVLRRSMYALDDPGLVNVSRILMAHPLATEDDKIRGFQVSCEELPLATVVSIWSSLDEEKISSPPYLRAFTERLISQNLPLKAFNILSGLGNLEEEPGLRLLAIHALLDAGGTERLELAQYEISKLMEKEGDLRLPAYRFLSMVPLDEFRSGFFPELRKWVERQEGAAVDDHLLAMMQPLRRLNGLPQEKENMAQEVIDAYSQSDPAAVARWLIQVDMAEKALNLLPEEQSLSDRDLYRLRAQALIDMQSRQQALQWLEDAPNSFPLVELHAMRVVAEGGTSDPAKRRKAWGLAMKNAGSKGNPNDFIELHDRMQDAGLDEFAKEAMVEALRIGRGRLPLWAQVSDLLPWLRARKEGQAMLDICTTMAGLEPTNVELLMESLDLSCIFGRIKPSDLVKKLQAFQERSPELLDYEKFVELKATAQLASREPGEALITLNGAQDNSEASGRAVVIAGIASALLGEDAASTELLSRVDWNQMFIEEKEFFTSQLDGLSASARIEASAKAFDNSIAPKELPGISDSVEAMFMPKELPPIGTEEKE